MFMLLILHRYFVTMCDQRDFKLQWNVMFSDMRDALISLLAITKRKPNTCWLVCYSFNQTQFWDVAVINIHCLSSKQQSKVSRSAIYWIIDVIWRKVAYQLTGKLGIFIMENLLSASSVSVGLQQRKCQCVQWRSSGVYACFDNKNCQTGDLPIGIHLWWKILHWHTTHKMWHNQSS